MKYALPIEESINCVIQLKLLSYGFKSSASILNWLNKLLWNLHVTKEVYWKSGALHLRQL